MHRTRYSAAVSVLLLLTCVLPARAQQNKGTTWPPGGIVIFTKQEATFLTTNNQRFEAYLVYLDDDKVLFARADGQVQNYPASKFQLVQTKDENLYYRASKKQWEPKEKGLLKKPRRGGDMNLAVTISLARPLAYQEIQGTLKKIDTDQSIVFDYKTSSGRRKRLSCPPGMASFVFLGNDSEYLGLWMKKDKERGLDMTKGYNVYFLMWYDGYLDGRHGVVGGGVPSLAVVTRASATEGVKFARIAAAETMTEHMRADRIVREFWTGKGDSEAQGWKYTWTSDWARKVQSESQETILSWWEREGTDVDKEFVKDLASAGYGPAVDVMDIVKKAGLGGRSR